MIDKFPDRSKKQLFHYMASVELASLKDVPVSAQTIPHQLQAAIDTVQASQGPNFGNFGSPEEGERDLLLEDKDQHVYLAVRMLDDNSVDGLVVDEQSRVVRFFSDTSASETYMGVSLFSEGTESAASLERRLAAIKEFAEKRCALTVYSSSNLSGDQKRIWVELEAQGKAKQRNMPNGDVRYFLQ